VALSVHLSHCMCVCPHAHRISLGGEGNVLYPVLSGFRHILHCYDDSEDGLMTCWTVAELTVILVALYHFSRSCLHQ